jgi:hypothetical protein
MVGWPGLEPGTNSLKGYCSTIELPTLGRERRKLIEHFSRRKAFPELTGILIPTASEHGEEEKPFKFPGAAADKFRQGGTRNARLEFG